ncbi:MULTISPECIES: ATP-grasp domain-containing protein [Gammaproteobacteria]|uniref:ATP-grasp domain-containing protein n=1 Tax=Gammaproteobacteria TaxID=1236 RepID=UPI003FB891AB
MNKVIYFASLPNGYFGSSANSWSTLDVKKLASSFLSKSYEVRYISITDIPEINFSSTDVLIYTSSDNEEIRSYLKDILYFKKDQCKLIPNYEILLAHENKGFQEVIKNKLGIDELKGSYFFDISQFKQPQPYVLKTIDGSGSSGVNLIKSEQDLKKAVETNTSVSLKRKLKNIVRSYQLPEDSYLIYTYYYKPFKRFVAQDFIKDLTCDYRILVVGKRFYAMRRDVRKGDFRASGSKQFFYHDVPLPALDYAKEVFDKLKNPYISMDVVVKDGHSYLIEYQGTNFGSSVLRKSDGYYVRNNNDWEFVKEQSQHEEALSQGLLDFVETNYE